MITEKIGPYQFFAQGFRGTQVNEPENRLSRLRQILQGLELQVLRADRVAGREHLTFAARNAVNSFLGKDRRTKYLSMEFLLFASGQHQIVEAIKLLGVAPRTTELVVVGLSESIADLDFVPRAVHVLNGVPDDSVIDVRSVKKIQGLKKAYRISDRELDCTRVPFETDDLVLKRLIIERSAMLDLEN